MRRTLFWSSALLVLYTYVGYPVVLALRARIAPRPWARAEHTPRVSLIMVCHNEARVLGSKLDTVRRLDYPSDALEVIVASDGSTDETVAIARQHAQDTEVLDLPRRGKAAGLNAAIERASGDILVFTDANSLLDPQAMRNLVRNFADPAIGGVAGDQRYLGSTDRHRGERTYWNLDRWLKQLESAAGSTISATGALYAIRAELARLVPPDVTDDYYQSAGVVRAGQRLVFDAEAVALEVPRGNETTEFSRKVRIITRGLTGVVRHRALLDVRRFGFYAVQTLTHKVLRRLVFVPLAALLVTAWSLWSAGSFYRAAALAQGAFYALATGGLAVRGLPIGRRRWLAIPAFFLGVNGAAAMATFNVLRGRRVTSWTPGTEADEA